MTTTFTMDHIVISAETLQTGVDYVQDTLGVKMAAGGKHPLMGTHNALMGLGNVYLEVIAIDPDAPMPSQPRWFDLDNFRGEPRSTNWVARTNDMTAALTIGPKDWGQPMELSRDDLTWVVAIAENGKLPFNGAFPGCIDWGNTAHPSTRLPNVGCTLNDWHIRHPEEHALKAAFNRLPGDMERHVSNGAFALVADIDTPSGLRTLE